MKSACKLEYAGFHGSIFASNPLRRSNTAHGDTMGIWAKITDFLFGCKLATTEQVKVAVDIALDNIDIDKDGYVSVGEFIKYVRAVLNYGTK